MIMKRMGSPFFLISLLLGMGCQKPGIPSGGIEGYIQEGSPEIILGGEKIIPNEKGVFRIEQRWDYSTIINLTINENPYEIYVETGKTVRMKIWEDSISFEGELFAENEHLLSDKKLNDELGVYFNKNWYSLHSKAEEEFIRVLDSIRGLYLSSLDRAARHKSRSFSPDFISVNSAAIHYSMDRLLLHYPEWKRRFTGTYHPLSEQAIFSINSQIDVLAYHELESYQTYVKTWLDQQINQAISKQSDSSFYLGHQKSKLTLELISMTFEQPELRDFWSFEYIKSHIDQFTWVNGQDFLSELKAQCATPRLCKEILAYEQELLEEREGKEIYVYKSEKGYQLEAHLFRPQEFDANKVYPVLAAFHGGGWMAGHADWTFESTRHAAENGMIGVAFEYRLSNREDISPMEAVEDTRDAIQWLRKYADSLRIDPAKILAKGVSAGGHLVLATSILQDYDKGEKSNPIPNALILVSPAIDTHDDYFVSLLREGISPANLSPLENLTQATNMPPVLLLQGKTDRLTPTKFAEQFKAKMDSLNYPCKLVIYEGCGHLFTPAHLDDTGFPQPDPEITRLSYKEHTAFYKELGYVVEN